jgi:tRNA U55 pseudouridine synthase TruB
MTTLITRRLSLSAAHPRICSSLQHLPLNLDGLLLPLVKPVGPTSQQCLTRLKRLIGGKKLEVFAEPFSASTVKVGYAGTLDPLASGLLICGFGCATRDLLAIRCDV